MRKGIAGLVCVLLICTAEWTTAVADSPVVQFEGRSYQRIDTSYSWHAARANCATMNAHLVTMTSAAENQFVRNAFSDQGQWFWIGATDEANEGTWRWVTGEPWVYEGWGLNEPNDMDAGEDYGILWYEGDWNDVASTAGGACMSGACGQGVYPMPSVCEWDDFEPPPPTFGFAAKPTARAYGNQALYTSTMMSFWLTNKGTAPLPITSVSIVGLNPAMFSFDNRCGTSVAVGAGCSIRVTFSPTSVGDKSAKLRVVAGDNDVRTKALSGTGVVSAFSVSPTSLHFGSVPINTTTAPRFVTISNTGSAELPISSITLAGWNPYQFTQTHNCAANLAVGASCTINLVFKPTDPVGSKAALLNITPGGGAAIRSVALAGAARR